MRAGVVKTRQLRTLARNRSAVIDFRRPARKDGTAIGQREMELTMKYLRLLGATAVMTAILSLATASTSLAARHHHHHWGRGYHHYYGGGGAGSWNSNPRNAESA
jgi:hypothetical protein